MTRRFVAIVASIRLTSMAAVFCCAATERSQHFVSPSTARQAAGIFITRHAVFREAALRLDAADSFRVDAIDVFEPATQARGALYHVSLQPQGYLVLSTDQRLPPVICFSAESDLVLDDVVANALRVMLTNDLSAASAVLQALDTGAYHAARPPPPWVTANTEEWDRLAGGGYAVEGTSARSTESISGPLLTSQWSQWRHYNARYPKDPAPGVGYDEKVPAGCIPVAGAQLSRFHAWPPYGKNGRNTVDDNTNNLVSGSFACDFRHTFDWTNMLDTYAFDQNEPPAAVDAMSRLVYDLAVAVGLDFGSFSAGGSFATLDSLGNALKSHFFYEAGSVVQRAPDPALFDQRVIDEILDGRPVIAGIPGHAVIIDGYTDDATTDFFHLNYGWGGQNDGWYQLSEVNSNSVKDALFDTRPRAVPLLDPPSEATNVSGTIELQWSFPNDRRPSLAAYTVSEGTLYVTNILDTADSMASWAGDFSSWEIRDEGHPGNCIRKTGEPGSFALDLNDFIVPSSNGVVEFDYRACLQDDHFSVLVSTNGGYSWVTAHHLTATGWNTDWHHAAIDLTAYAGGETRLRFLYRLESGTYWSMGGMWLDNIEIEGVRVPRWQAVRTGLAPGTHSAILEPRLDGTYFHRIAADNGAEGTEVSPYRKTVVVLAAELDVDGDGMANGWETEHYGSPTGAVAGADSDKDGFSNLGEYLAATAPHDSNSFFTVRSVAREEAGMALAWPSVSNRTYGVWCATNLVDTPPHFTCVTSGIAATPPTNWHVHTATAGRGHFYQVEIETD